MLLEDDHSSSSPSHSSPRPTPSLKKEEVEKEKEKEVEKEKEQQVEDVIALEGKEEEETRDGNEDGRVNVNDSVLR